MPGKCPEWFIHVNSFSLPNNLVKYSLLYLYLMTKKRHKKVNNFCKVIQIPAELGFQQMAELQNPWYTLENHTISFTFIPMFLITQPRLIPIPRLGLCKVILPLVICHHSWQEVQINLVGKQESLWSPPTLLENPSTLAANINLPSPENVRWLNRSAHSDLRIINADCTTEI